MSVSRKILIACALALLLIAAGLWLASTRVTAQTIFPGRSQNGLSLAELNQVEMAYLFPRYAAYGAAGMALICLLAAFPPRVPVSMGVRPRAKRTRDTIIAAAISGVLGGLVGGANGNFSGPFSYAPGLLFGLCFARVNFVGPLWMGLYTVASGLVYMIAYHTHQTVSSCLPAEPAGHYLILMIAGAIGGLGLAVSTKLLAGAPLTLEHEAVTLTLGAFLAVPFLWLFIPPLGSALAFALWQIPVGAYLATSLQKGPVVQAVGQL